MPLKERVQVTYAFPGPGRANGSLNDSGLCIIVFLVHIHGQVIFFANREMVSFSQDLA